MLLMHETFVNETKGYQFGESGWYEPYTDDRGKLFRSLQREYGRCMSSMYVDTAEGAQKCGWVFQSKQEYEDSGRYGRKPEYYIREVWVHLREQEDTTAD